MLTLNTLINNIPGVGPIQAARFNKLGIITVENLISHYPSRYEDYSLISRIRDLQEGETVTVIGRLEYIKNEYTKYRRIIQKAKIKDDSGGIDIIWFNQPFLTKNLQAGQTVSCSGRVGKNNGRLRFESPEYETAGATGGRGPGEGLALIHTGRLVPVYPETSRLTSKFIRKTLVFVFPQIKGLLKEYLPEKILKEDELIGLGEALEKIHFPLNRSDINRAKERLAFDELFLWQMGAALRKKAWKEKRTAPTFAASGRAENGIDVSLKLKELAGRLPFKLTAGQRRAVKDIFEDLKKTAPMNRLILGDVGSGKTAVAAIAMYLTHLNGRQSVLMAPTEILAFQHYETIKNLLGPLNVKTALQTGSKKHITKENKESSGDDIIVGTHALIADKLKLDNPGLVVIDEQHRFGVLQRSKLQDKSSNAHLLTMTATPIPRTGALVFYGDLDLSFIEEMPAGRQKISTWVVPPVKRENAYRWIEKELLIKNRQMLVICPLIEESETLSSVKAAKSEFIKLQKIFRRFKVGLLHGRMKTQEKENILSEAMANRVNILVATPVVEVGIDLPDADIILIEASEKFGLAQLHQLRGRVGRRQNKGWCLLFSESQNPSVLNRLKKLETVDSGPRLAELDLQLRGPGDLYGIKQHGLPALKIASLADRPLINRAAFWTADILGEDPDLRKHPLLNRRVKNVKIEKVSPN